MTRIVTLHISPSKLKEYEDIFPNVLQPTPLNSSKNSSLLSKPPIKKIIIKKNSNSSNSTVTTNTNPSLSSPISTSISGTETPLTRTDTPNGSNNNQNNKGGRSGLAASANGGLLELDKSGNPCKKWVKKNRIFKSFTGYPIAVVMFKEDHRRSKIEKA